MPPTPSEPARAPERRTDDAAATGAVPAVEPDVLPEVPATSAPPLQPHADALPASTPPLSEPPAEPQPSQAAPPGANGFTPRGRLATPADEAAATEGVLSEDRKRSSGLGGMFRRRSAPPQRAPGGVPAPQRAVAPLPAAQPQPPERRPEQQPPPRRAAAPLPWGRDFAAAVIHRDDGLNAIFGKLDAADSPRVALVAPHGNVELGKPLGMRRLRRYVDHSGKDVIIVTHSSAVRSRAHDVGLAVTGNVKRVDFERYGRSGLRFGGVIVPLPGLGLLLRLASIVIAIAVLAAAVLLYLPKATITVYPTYTAQRYAADVTLLGTATSGALPAGQLAANRRSESLSRTVLFPVHGTTTVKGPDGNDQQVASPTDDDLKQADAFAQQVLLDEGRNDLASHYSSETMVKQSAVLSAYTSKANAKAGEPADLIRLTVSGQVTMLSADNNALRKLLETALLPTTLRTQMFVPQTFTATVVSAGPFDKNNNQISVNFTLSESTTNVFSPSALKSALKGKSRTAAQQAVDARVDESAPAKVSVNPGWAPALPRFGGRIDVNIATPTPTPSPAPSPSATAAPSATPAPQ